MVEIYGWVRVSDSVYESEWSRMEKIIADLREPVESLDSENPVLKTRFVNGAFILSIFGVFNHKIPTVSEIISLLEDIVKIAPGSYGLLHLLDDEDVEYHNQFQVYKLAKGNVTLEKDMLLSPCDPIIFDN